MIKDIRLLSSNDFSYFDAMETGMDSDYISSIFADLTTGDNRLYGLFLDGRMIVLCGYSIYAKHYAMLGRLRSDQRFSGNGYATELVTYVLKEAQKLSGIRWIGANTEEDNVPARRLLKRLNLAPYLPLYGATAEDTTVLESGSHSWQPITRLARKREWIDKLYIQTGAIFPYECFYPFPASDDLFSNDILNQWSFYENDDRTRFVITKYDRKKYHLLHVVYPWRDVTSQPGLWETIRHDYVKLKQHTNETAYIWIDLTKDNIQTLPDNHPFQLSAPWILHGMPVT
ncbi:hypothetical protein GCM10028778_14940 [Barrientosiimonas marina]|uniref:GNAT family N-acetyltransferase n=1 Tax=Lentibacillus kimchii TaxID=1542911 RepID=A0ABW2UT52_9BACI